MLKASPPRVHRLAHASWRWRTLLASTVVAVLVLRAPQSLAASFEPGTEADPPTGATPEAQTPDPAIDGIRWEFAPLAHSGSLSIDGRWLDTGNGVRSTQWLTVGDINFATYVWQPWFVQVRAGLGLVLVRDTTREVGSPSRTATNPASTGRLSVSVFPMSRFPFEMRAEVTDSRVQGDALGADFRAERFSLSQSYAPQTGSQNYNLRLDHSRRTTLDGVSDAVTSLSGSATRQWATQVLNLSALHVSNRRSDTGDSSRNSAITLHHNHNAAGSLQVDSLASWNRSQFEDETSAFDASTDIRQISTFSTWRPREGEWLYSERSPVSLSGSARLVQTRATNGDDARRQQAMNLSLGANQDLTRELRLSGSASASLLSSGSSRRTHITVVNAAATYTPEVMALGEWRYAPSLGANVGVNQRSDSGARQTLGAQAVHAVSRSYMLGESDSLSVAISQSLGAFRESDLNRWARQLTHSSSLSWQGMGEAATQSYAAFSLSDSRTWATERGSFQLANLQVSRRTQLSRDTSWSGNLTVQASRSDDTQARTSSLDAIALDEGGTQRFYSGGLSYESRRVWGVPRLRFSATLSLNSQQLESRPLGDVDAPRERITKSLEGRFDYAIGRLDTRLTSRWVEADGRRIASIFFRVQRQF